MRILQLAPHPFYIDRGTPIDVRLVLQVLSERGDRVDVVVYNEGEDIELDNLTIYRTPESRLTRGLPPGFSFGKLIASTQLVIKAFQLLRKHDYDVIHAGEESVFAAMIFNRLFGVPYVYDLDSSVAQQMVEKMPALKPLGSFFGWLEGRAIRGALVNFPVCNALAELCDEHDSGNTVTLHDISQLAHPAMEPNGTLRKEVGLDKKFMLYVGNFESYQGVDLLIDAFAIAARQIEQFDLVIIGGTEEGVDAYKEKCTELGIADRVHLLGRRPFDKLDEYIADAEILCCPRIKGVNTPMKIFPYLHSKRATLVTDIYTHNQILTANEAYLAEATAEGFAHGMIVLAEDEALRNRIAEGGYEMVERNHVYRAHKERLTKAYDWIESKIARDAEVLVSAK